MSTHAFWKNRRILVTGGAGFIGSYVVDTLQNARGVGQSDIIIPRSNSLDLRKYENCRAAVKGCQVVIHLAAVTGGISFSREHPASQYHDSTLIDLNMVEASRQEGVEKFVAIGNLFSYASNAPIPLKEEYLFDGLPTDAHRGVGWFKRNLALMADFYFREYGFPMVVVYSANAYGPGDSIDPGHSHVIPGTIMKCMKESELIVWGDGSPTRDFLYVQDIAEGLIAAAERLKPPAYVNIGSGAEISVKELVTLIADISGFKGTIRFDVSKSGGDARRCTSIDKAKQLIGFAPTISMREGLERTIQWYTMILKERETSKLSQALQGRK